MRDLQERTSGEILEALQAANPPESHLLVKLAPDLSDAELADLLPVVQGLAAGVIASQHHALARRPGRSGLPEIRGGLSGAPLRARSTAVIKKIYNLTMAACPIIGVGGVETGDDAFEKILAGASLVQMYTGLVYGGPAAAYRAREELAVLLSSSGFSSVAAAVGRDARESLA